jgi:hypothetical protein
MERIANVIVQHEKLERIPTQLYSIEMQVTLQ